jgi:hypothetical protein
MAQEEAFILPEPLGVATAEYGVDENRDGVTDSYLNLEASDTLAMNESFSSEGSDTFALSEGISSEEPGTLALSEGISSEESGALAMSESISSEPTIGG